MAGESQSKSIQTISGGDLDDLIFQGTPWKHSER